jgi:hypothetical protein
MADPAAAVINVRGEIETIFPGATYNKEWMLFGSSVMFLHGLRDEIQDVDIFVSPVLWGMLIASGWDWKTPKADDPPIAEKEICGFTIHAFFDWDQRHGYRIFEGGIVNSAFAHAIKEIHHGKEFWCQSLEELLRWKKWLYSNQVHEKHGRDAKTIEIYLARAG